MIQIIWFLINTLLFLYFLYLCFGFIFIEKKVFQKRFKVISIIIVVLGIIQILVAVNIKNEPKRFVINEIGDRNHNTVVKKVKLEDNMLFDINLNIKYNLEQGEYIPISAYSEIDGFVSGFEWELTTITASNYRFPNNPDYDAYGVLKWNLFGINIYSQAKEFEM